MNREECEQRLAGCRAEIDEIDRELIAMMNRRTRVVEEIGRLKQDLKLAIYEPRREDQVFENVLSANGGPLSNDAARRIFERIIDEMRTVQRNRMIERGEKDK